MKTKTRIAVLLTALCLAVSSFCGCEKTPAEPENTETPFEPVLLAEDNTTHYVLVRPDETSDAVIELYKVINNAAKSGGIAFYEGETDWVKEGTDKTGDKEILLGYTNRPETQKIMDSLGYGDYAIVTEGNKLVVAAHCEEKLTEAVNYLVANLLKHEEKDGKTCLYLTGTYTSRSDVKNCFCGAKLADVSVVYPAGSSILKASAEELAEEMKDVYGTELNVIADSQAKTGAEIVIGSCKRDICGMYSSSENTLGSKIIASGGSLLIISSNDSMTAAAVENFTEDYINNYYTDTIAIADGYSADGDVYKFKDSPERAEGTDIRVMSYNILCELWNSMPAIAGRDTTDQAVFFHYMPDVIGLQEVSPGWYSALNKLFGDTYAFTDTKNAAGSTNFSPLAYNTQTLTLLEHGVRNYSVGNDSRLRLVSWGYFEIKASGKRFVAFSTHWDLGSNDSYRLTQAKEMAAMALEFEKKYDCAVVTTGDLNTLEGAEAYNAFTSATGYTEAKFTAKVIAYSGKSYHTLGKSNFNHSIDHILGSPDRLEFLYYNVIRDECVLAASDHCPIYADVKLK